MKKLLLTLVLTCATATASANIIFYSGNELLAEMKDSSNAAAQTFAMGYVAGIHDMYSGSTVCKPKTASLQQVTDVVKQEIEARPDIRHFGAHRLVSSALARAWPCAEKKPVKGASL